MNQPEADELMSTLNDMARGGRAFLATRDGSPERISAAEDQIKALIQAAVTPGRRGSIPERLAYAGMQGAMEFLEAFDDGFSVHAEFTVIAPGDGDSEVVK